LKRPFTVVDSIEATQVLYDSAIGPALVSPDEKGYLVVLQRGDVGRNGSWVELLVGSLASVQSAGRATTVSRLFTRSTARVWDLIQNVRWLNDNRRVVFIWDDGLEPPRIVSVDVRTHRMQTLVRHSTPIVKYDVSANGQTIVFMAQSPRDRIRNARLERDGFAIGAQAIWPILRGDFDASTPGPNYETFVYGRSDGRIRKIREPKVVWSNPPELLKLSPDGRYAVEVRPVREVPRSWDSYTEHLFRDIYLPAARQNPEGPTFIRQYFLVAVKESVARPLWDAPENPSGNAVWSPSSHQLAIGPTFLPVDQATPAGLAGKAVVTVDAMTGQYESLPVPENLSGPDYRPSRWNESDAIEIVDANAPAQDKANVAFKKVHGKWEEVAKTAHSRPPGGVRIELREDPNTPPALYAVDIANNFQRLIRDLNPELRTKVSLGHVASVHWMGSDGKPWTGMAYYPVHYESGRSYPLVIQTHGYLSKRFSLDGSYSTAFAAQALANRDIAVLQIGGPDGGFDDIVATPKEVEAFTAGCEGAIQFLVTAGLVDPAKVGIIGFSRTGWLVEYMLTHSRTPLAAAEVADNIDGSYFQYVLDPNDRRIFDEQGNGGRPFGDALGIWARMAPGYNADRVQVPLRMELDSGPIDSVLSAWEMFSNLRYLRKPVELFVIPDIQHGVHVLQNPAQRLASQGGTVDWFSFWLKGEEDPDPRKAAQYARWRVLRKEQK
jgi:dipeptidyl aminopeptidase/acylaminoacyl peptidase